MTFYAVLLYDFGPREHVFMPVSTAALDSTLSSDGRTGSTRVRRRRTTDCPSSLAAPSLGR